MARNILGRQGAAWLGLMVLWGCQSTGSGAPVATPNQPPAVPARIAGTEGAGSSAAIVASNTASLSGVVLGPSAGLVANNTSSLVANNAAGLISNNAGGLISNNAGGLISNNAAGFRVEDANTPLEPIAGARVVATDWQGAPLADASAISDASGHFTLQFTATAGAPILVKASFERAGYPLVLICLTDFPGVGATIQVPSLDPAHTLVTKKTLGLVGAGQLAPAGVTPAAIALLANALGPVMNDAAVVRACWESGELAGNTYDAMLTQSPALATALTQLAKASSADALAIVSATPAAPAAGHATDSGGGAPRDTISGVVR